MTVAAAFPHHCLIDRLPVEMLFEVAQWSSSVKDSESLLQAYYRDDWTQQTDAQTWIGRRLDRAVERAHGCLHRPEVQARMWLEGRTQSFRHAESNTPMTEDEFFVSLGGGDEGRAMEQLRGDLDDQVRDYIYSCADFIFLPPVSLGDFFIAVVYGVWVETSFGALKTGANLAGRVAGSRYAWSDLQPYVSTFEKCRRGAIIAGSCALMAGCLAGAFFAGSLLTVGMGFGLAIFIGCLGGLTGVIDPATPILSGAGVPIGLFVLGLLVVGFIAYKYRHQFPIHALVASLLVSFASQAHKEIDSLAEQARSGLQRQNTNP